MSPAGDVRVLTDVPVELRHERLAEPHDLGVRPAARVEVAAALAAADAETGQRVLEDLLEAEELHDAQVHRRVEPQTTLVRAERAVELHAVAPVDVDLAVVVLPRDTEDDLPLGLHQPLDEGRVRELRTLREGRSQGFEHLVRGLEELGLRRIAPLDVGEQGGDTALRVRAGHWGPFRRGCRND